MPRKTPMSMKSRANPARFNEAAARCRGKRGQGPGNDAADHEASMRPRPDAAENILGAAEHGEAAGFNEAAARCRGKPPCRPRHSWCYRPGFNEAAARCRGKR